MGFNSWFKGLKLYSKGRLDRHLSDSLPVINDTNQEDALSPIFSNSATEFVIRKVQEIQEGLKLNGTHQFMVYTNDVSILGGSIDTIKEKHKCFSSRKNRDWPRNKC